MSRCRDVRKPKVLQIAWKFVGMPTRCVQKRFSYHKSCHYVGMHNRRFSSIPIYFGFFEHLTWLITVLVFCVCVCVCPVCVCVCVCHTHHRPWLVDLSGAPAWMYFATAIPAMLCTILLFLGSQHTHTAAAIASLLHHQHHTHTQRDSENVMICVVATCVVVYAARVAIISARLLLLIKVNIVVCVWFLF